MSNISFRLTQEWLISNINHVKLKCQRMVCKKLSKKFKTRCKWNQSRPIQFNHIEYDFASITKVLKINGGDHICKATF